MPRRALRCVVDLDIRRVSAPGVWLPSREDVYLSISLFGQYRNTRLVKSEFPLILHEPFRFEKTYYTAVDPSDVAEFLEDELIVVELLQMSDFSSGAIRLASFATSARDFLYPYPTLCPSYASKCREILLSRTIAFPGISPKLEFITKSVIKESRTPEEDALEDALEEAQIARRSRSRSRSRTRGRSRSLSRTRSLSRSRTPRSLDSDSDSDDYSILDPSYMRPTISSILHSRSRSAVRSSFDDESLSSLDLDTSGKPPFVVRHLENDLIGRKPGSPPLKPQKLKKGRKKSRSRPSSALSGGVCSARCPACFVLREVYASEQDCLVCRAYERHMGKRYWGHSSRFHPTGRPCCPEVLRDSYGSTPVYTTKYVSDDEDAEVAALTSSYVTPTRPRSASPYLYKSSYSSRFGRSPSPVIEAKVERALRRARSRSPSPYRRRSPSPYRRSPSPYRYSPTPILRDSMDNLAIDTSIVKNRSWVHLDAGSYWSDKAAELSGQSHRELLNTNMNRLYRGLYRNAKKGAQC